MSQNDSPTLVSRSLMSGNDSLTSANDSPTSGNHSLTLLQQRLTEKRIGLGHKSALI